MSKKRASAEKEELWQRLQKVRDKLMDAIAGLTEEQMRRRPGPGRWSVAEVMAHLPDWERQVLRQAQSLGHGSGRTIVFPSQAEREDGAGRGRRLPPPGIVHDLVAARWDTLRFLENLTTRDLNRRGDSGQKDPLRLGGVLARIADYEDEQATQIRRLREELNLPPPKGAHAPL